MNVKELRIILSLTERSERLPVLRSLPPLQPGVLAEYDELPDDALEIYGVGAYQDGPLLFLQHPEESVFVYPLTPTQLYGLLAPFYPGASVYLLPPLAREPVEPLRWTTLVSDLARPATRCALVLPCAPAD